MVETIRALCSERSSSNSLTEKTTEKQLCWVVMAQRGLPATKREGVFGKGGGGGGGHLHAP